MANYEAFIETRSIAEGQLIVETTPIDAQIAFHTRRRSSPLKEHRVGPLLRAEVTSTDLTIFGRNQTDSRLVDVSAEKRQGRVDLSPTQTLVVKEQAQVIPVVVYSIDNLRINQRQARLIQDQ